MATTDSTPALPIAQDTKSSEKVEKLSKVDKPDEEKFRKDLSEAEKEINTLQEKMVHRHKLNWMNSYVN